MFQVSELQDPVIRRLSIAGAILSISLLVIVGLLTHYPMIAACAAFAIIAVIATLYWPDAASAIVVFVFYSNAAVVAVKFHSVPGFIGQLAIAPLLIPLIYHILVRRQPIVLTATVPAILAFVVVQTLSALFAQHTKLAIGGVKTSVLEGLIIYLVITNVIRSWDVARRAVWALLFAGAFMGGLSGLQQATRNFNNDYGGFAQVSDGDGFAVQQGRGSVKQRRLCGPIGEKNRYSQIMLLIIPLGYLMAVSQTQRNWRFVAAACTAATTVGFALAFSRGGAVAFLLVVMLMAAMRYVKGKHIMAIGVLTLLFLVAVPQYRARLVSIPMALKIFQQHGSAADEPDGAIRGRATAMLAAMRVWLDHPVLGVGPDCFGLHSRTYGMLGGFRALQGERQAHNLFLEILAEQGILGLGAFLAILAISLIHLENARRSAAPSHPEMAAVAAGFILAIIGYLATGLFLHFSYIRYFWLMLALADATAIVIQQRVRTEQPREAAIAAT